MSQDNVELAYQAIDAFNRRDLSAYLNLVDADVEFIAGGVLMEGAYHGHAGIRRVWENLLGVFPDLAIELIEVRDLGDLTLGAGRARGHGAGSDTPFDETVWATTEWRDGKCVRFGNYVTEADALEAVRLWEQAMSRENVEIVRRAYEVGTRVDERAVLALVEAGLVDPDGVLDLSTAYPDGPVLRLEDLRGFFDTQPWGRSVRLEAESFRPVGSDRVLVFLRLHALGTGSGIEVEARTAHLVTLRDNRIVRAEVYTDRSKALEAAGLRE